MFSKKTIFGNLISLGFLLSVTSGVAVAQMPMEMPASSSNHTTQFRRIEQPLGLKAAVTLGGLGLIGLELWWFRFSKTKAQKAESNQGIQETTITVDGGYEPTRIVVNAGKPVRLNFLRRDASSCLEKVLLPDFHIVQELSLNHVTPIEFTPEKPGQYSFTCGMNMFRGVVEVQASGSSKHT
jgi:plastocyanin domain-containing protein